MAWTQRVFRGPAGQGGLTRDNRKEQVADVVRAAARRHRPAGRTLHRRAGRAVQFCSYLARIADGSFYRTAL
jgi:hypothetical protein